jgi:hypothetical protein
MAEITKRSNANEDSKKMFFGKKTHKSNKSSLPIRVIRGQKKPRCDGTGVLRPIWLSAKKSPSSVLENANVPLGLRALQCPSIFLSPP